MFEITEKVRKLVEDYRDVTIGIFGSHSAKEIGMAAKAWGFRTVIVVQKGRDKLYTKYNRHLYDEFIVLDRFKDMLNEEVQ